MPESEFKTLEALNFPLPVSVRLPLAEQQDVRRLDVFDCFEEEPLAEVEARHPNGQTSGLVGGSTAKGGGWKETQRVEAGTVELEVSWKLNHKPETPAAQQVQVEEESGLSQQDVLPDPPALWELWLPLPQADDLDSSEAPRLQKAEPVYTPNIESLLDSLQEPLSVVHTVDPRDAEQNCTKWMPPIHKEIGVIERAVQRLPPDEVRSGGWLRRKEVKVVPSKFVFLLHAAREGLWSSALRGVGC